MYEKSPICNDDKKTIHFTDKFCTLTETVLDC